MASSGTINGTPSGTQPYLRISWSILSQDIPNNRSRVMLQLILVAPYSLNFSASKTGSNNGASFTYTGGFSGTGTRTLNTRDIWVDHNDDGTRTQSVNGSFNIQVNWGGSHLSGLSVSGSMNLDTIPRASSLSSFSINAHLQPSTANQVNLSISRASSSFTHDIQLRDGSTVIASWNGQGLPTTLPISGAQVNTLLNRMPNTSTQTLTLRVQTKSGSTNIGSAVSRNATATVHSRVTPTATGLRVLISGSGRDVTIGKFVQGISRVFSDFTGTAIGGATVSSRSIVIRENSSKSNSMTISGNSGTTGTVTRSGTYEAIASVTDSRGRTATQRITFTVHAYSPPRATVFTAERNASTPTTVNITRAGSFTPLGSGDNTLSILIQRRIAGGSWTNVQSTSTTSSTFSGTATSTGNSVTISYEFRFYISDSFGNNAEATANVTTQRVVLDIHKNEGVGIGKIHERGVLDVDGEIYLSGGMFLTGIPTGGPSGRDYQLVIDPEQGHSAIEIGSTTHNSLAFIDFHSRAGDNDYDARIMTRDGVTGDHGRGVLEITAERLIYRDKVDGNFHARDIIGQGSNARGIWVRFYDGTQICIDNYQSNVQTSEQVGNIFRSSTGYDWVFPAEFIELPSVNLGIRRTAGGPVWAIQNGEVDAQRITNVRIAGVNNSTWAGYRLSAIGRWR